MKIFSDTNGSLSTIFNERLYMCIYMYNIIMILEETMLNKLEKRPNVSRR